MQEFVLIDLRKAGDHHHGNVLGGRICFQSEQHIWAAEFGQLCGEEIYVALASGCA